MAALLVVFEVVLVSCQTKHMDLVGAPLKFPNSAQL